MSDEEYCRHYLLAAISDFKESIRIKPDYEDAYYWLDTTRKLN
jgi:hypothetical protein